jgi:hypothetical protein
VETVLTEAQVWMLIGLFATLVAVMFGVIQRSIAVSADGIRAEIAGLRAETMARFDAVDRRIDGLDRDVHMLVNRAVGGDPG